MESKAKKSFGLLSSISKGLRGLAGKSDRRPAEGAAPAKQRAFDLISSNERLGRGAQDVTLQRPLALRLCR